MHACRTTVPVCSNNLTDLPDDLGDLLHIRVLRIKYNQISRLPAAVARLPDVVTLELSGNQIAKLDSYVAKVCGKQHSSRRQRGLQSHHAAAISMLWLQTDTSNFETQPQQDAHSGVVSCLYVGIAAAAPRVTLNLSSEDSFRYCPWRCKA